MFHNSWGWSGDAMVLGKLPVPERPIIWMIVGQGPIALAVGAGGGCLDIFTLLYPFSHLLPLSWGRPRYRLKGPLNPKQNKQTNSQVLARGTVLYIFSAEKVLLTKNRVAEPRSAIGRAPDS